ncbi:DUF3558 domain-containing protein [Rhodococcus sp. ARC_M6]|uniref:DUF3558 domain-containing protein n=1 Tax=Rhodococcus sp. ARC_M6 TaxID=2928852 RepID=UPI001FB45C8E|nr:DUF3558 domain-containing protein [Rhodococcus sp. ARC_M6]MCJ0906529.1 DUF3558 domain-containing protein [Rhodococcus sp. ARC_M6]
MRASTGVVRLLVAGILVWTAAGCGSAVEGAAEPASGQEGLFNPCTDIPDSVIAGVGLDPATKKVDIEGIEQPGWKICRWTSSWYFLSILSTEYLLDDVRDNQGYTKLGETPVGDRVGLQFRRESDESFEGCYLAIEAKQGSVWINIEAKAGQSHEVSTCGLVEDFATRLDSSLPR